MVSAGKKCLAGVDPAYIPTYFMLLPTLITLDNDIAIPLQRCKYPSESH